MCSAWLAVTYTWYRIEYRVPRALQRFANVPRVLIQLGGSVVVVVVLMYSVGGILGSKTQVSKNPVRYAHRVDDAAVFWAQIARQMTTAVVFGGALIALGRAPFRARKRVTIPTPAE